MLIAEASYEATLISPNTESATSPIFIVCQNTKIGQQTAILTTFFLLYVKGNCAIVSLR